MEILKKILLFSIVVVLIPLSVQSTEYYVHAGAIGSGDGSAWNNALDDLPASLERGAIYWIADGSYGSYTFDDAESDTTSIQIRKATASAHGTETGWSSGYGDGQAVFDAIIFTSDDWILDGQVGGGPDSWNSGFGFEVYREDTGDLVIISGERSNIAIRHTKIYSTLDNLGNGIKATTGSGDNITISYCQISDVFGCQFHIGNWTNCTIDYSYFARNKSTPAEHSEAISSFGTNENIIIRYNIWDEITGTAVFAGVNVGSSVNWQIYGNIFARSVSTIYYYWDAGSNQNSMTNSEFYNNIIVGIDGVSQGGLTVNQGSGNTSYNNIWYDNDANSFVQSNFTHDYNYADSNIRSEDGPIDKDEEVVAGEANGLHDLGNPFADYQADPLNADFSLSADAAAIDAGDDLGSPYDTDMDGNTRGDDGYWDIGALEFAYGLHLPPELPIITSVILFPDAGYAGIGDTITITVTEANNTSGLTASDATFNDQQIPLNDQGGGIYSGNYTVAEGDNSVVHPEATNITLTGSGGTSDPASSSGSTLIIDAQTPAISSVTLNPSSGDVNPGQSVTITATAINNESGLAVSDATFAGASVPMSDIGGGDYRGTYVIQADDQGGEFASDAVFNDNFENGTSKWQTVDTGIVVGDIGKLGDHGVQYTVQSTDRKQLAADIGSDQTETYTSFYFRVDQDFYLANNDIMYISLLGNDNGSAWAARLNRINGQYNINVYLGAWVTQIGSDIPIVPGEWYWIKIHHRSDVNGLAEWWLNGEYAGQYNGDTSGAASRSFSGVYLNQMDAGTTGTVYYDHFQVTTTDHSEPMVLEASGITLTDAAGNVSAPASSSGSSLHVVNPDPDDTTAPVIQTVTISPNSGEITVGDTVAITVTESNNEAGLTASNATINTRPVSLAGQGDGTYTGVYTVQAGDPLGVDIEATGITLTDAAGNVSAPASSRGSTLRVVEPDPDGPPEIASVSISPNSGYAGIGDIVQIVVTASGNQAGLTPSDATFNSTQVALTDQGDGAYTGQYTVAEGDNDIMNAEATGITLTGANGTSDPAASTGSSLVIDAHKPAVQSVVISPNSGTCTVGDEITITVAAADNEDGLGCSNASINGKSVPIAGLSNGFYRGSYVVQSGDPSGQNVEATGIVLTDAAGNSSAPGASSGSTLVIDADDGGANPPPPDNTLIASVTISPDSGYASIGDSITIVVTAQNNQSGLSSSFATINTRQIPLSDQQDGTYKGLYVIAEGDNDAANVEATNITLAGPDGRSEPASSTGSTLIIDANRPVIAGADIITDGSAIGLGDSIHVVVAAEDLETGLTPSPASLNGIAIPLTDNGDGVYSGAYIITPDDESADTVEASELILTDAAGNVSDPVQLDTSGLSIDTIPPEIASVVLSTPVMKVAGLGQSIDIIVTAVGNETGLDASDAEINDRLVPLYDVGDGTYRGQYLISSNDPSSYGVEAENIILTDLAENSSEPASSSDSRLSIIPMENPDIARSDFDDNGIVGFSDFILFAAAYGYSSGDPEYNIACDMDDNGSIGIIDFSLFASHYNQTAAAKIAPSAAKFANTTSQYVSSEIVYDMAMVMNSERTRCSAGISISNHDDLEGIHFLISYNADAVELIEDSLQDIPGLVIPTTGDGVVDVAAMFGDEPFDGSVNIEFSVVNPEISPDITLREADAATNFGVFKIPENGDIMQVAGTIDDVTVMYVSESYIELSWSAPGTEDNPADAYFVEIREACSENDLPGGIENYRLDMTPGSPGATETARISGLKSGAPYCVSLRYADSNNLISGSSTAVGTTTLARFIDDDIDPSDPFIGRDDDGLFVADNDDSLEFTWESWEKYGAEAYRVTVTDENAGDVVESVIVNENSFTIDGAGGVIYSVEIDPLASGDSIGKIISRAILCPASTLTPPGKPEMMGIY